MYRVFKQQPVDFADSDLWTLCMKMLQSLFPEFLRLVHLWPPCQFWIFVPYRSRPQHTKVDSGYDPYFFFLDKKWEKRTISFELFSFLFDKIYENSTKLYKNSTKLYEKITKIHEKSHKNSFVMVFTHFLSKKKKYGSFQESTLVHCGRDIGCKNLKLRR